VEIKKYIISVVLSLLIATNVGSQDLKETASGKITAFTDSQINAFSNQISENIASFAKDHFENMKYLDFTIDTQEYLKPTFSIMSVNEIMKLDSGTIFNQTSINTHDGDQTVNIGLGNRKLIKNDTVILGSNIFLDYQANEQHLRNGFGLEAISSVFDLRGNYYNAISGFKTTDDGREKALDGHDVQLNYHLFGKANTDIFLNKFEWSNPNSSFKVKGEKLGINSKIGRLQYDLGYLNNNKNSDGFFASLNFVVPLGEETKKPQQRNKALQYVSVRDKLYIPVQRENKIKVVKISKSGVQVSGF
jgi:adhesin/invasin